MSNRKYCLETRYLINEKESNVYNFLLSVKKNEGNLLIEFFHKETNF